MFSSRHLTVTAVLLLSNLVSADLPCFKSGTLPFQFSPTVEAGLSARVIANTLTSPRGIVFDDAGNLLVVEKGVGITALIPSNTESCFGWQRKLVVANTNLNHGIEYRLGKLYASTSDVLYRWSYDSNMSAITSKAVMLVKGMNNSDHNTRTLLLTPADKTIEPTAIIINRGSASNLDTGAIQKSTGRAQIRSFPVSATRNSSVKSWTSGRLLAWGVRNGVGLALGADGDLWEVENSADQLNWNGNDVSKDDPAEELNRIPLESNPSKVGSWYGYPYCFTAYKPLGKIATGGQFSQQPGYSDALCAKQNNTRPRLTFQAHSAPLDIKFFDATVAINSNSPYIIDAAWNSDAFVSFHGSWDRSPPTGYGVVRVPWDGDEPLAPHAAKYNNGSYMFIIQAPDMSKCPNQCIRPVGLAFHEATGRLFVSSDATGEVFIIQAASAPQDTP